MLFRRANPRQAYHQVATHTASPGHLVLMLYDGTIRFLEQARVGFTKDDPKEFNETINNSIQRAQAIINEMDQAVDREKGGEFAASMRRLYGYMDVRLQESNIRKSEEGVLDVIRRVTILREAWAEMMQTAGAATRESSAAAQTTLAAASE